MRIIALPLPCFNYSLNQVKSFHRMKKTLILLTLAVGGICFNTHAQHHRDAEGRRNVGPNKHLINQHLKAEKGEITTEFGLAGGLNNAEFELNEGGVGLLRGRYFIKEDMALRLGFSLGVSNDKSNIYGSNNEVGKSKTNNTNFILNLGFEKHFAGTANLSPYVGGDLLFGIAGQKQSLENTDGSNYVDDFNSEIKGPGSLSVGIRGIVGADYYITKHVYLGAEAGLGFLYSHEGKTKVTSTVSGHSSSHTVESAGSSFELTPSVITGIRIGFVF